MDSLIHINIQHQANTILLHTHSAFEKIAADAGGAE
jgi:hypothetical protein